MPSLTGLDVSGSGLTEEGELALAAAMARIEVGRGGVQFQLVSGVSEGHLEKARKERPVPPPDVLAAKHKDLAALPIWQFLNKQCKIDNEGHLDGVVAIFAGMGIQEMGDLSLWSDIEYERNMKNAGILEDLRKTIRACVHEKVRLKEQE